MSEKLKQALASLAAGLPLHEGAVALFGALGYRSERTLYIGDVSEFRETYDRGKLTPKQCEIFGKWRTVKFVFQVTDEEISGSQDREYRFDKSRIKSFLFLAVDLEGNGFSRTYLAGTARIINRLFAIPTIVLFRHGHTLTLAVAHRRVNKLDSSRDVLERMTLVKDIRTDAPHRAHVEILSELDLRKLVETGGVSNFDELHTAWEKALDIEVLNRRFYHELSAWFERAVEECRFPDEHVDDSDTEGTKIGDRKHDAVNQRQVIRLITRILFIWFLKEKELVPDDIFEEDFARATLREYESDSTDFYRAVLQNLFFATLNTEIAKRGFGGLEPAGHHNFTTYLYRGLLTDPERFAEKLKVVPFVNGGLFDCLDKFVGGHPDGFAGAEGAFLHIDAFTEDAALANQLKVPAHLFFEKTGGGGAALVCFHFSDATSSPLRRTRRSTERLRSTRNFSATFSRTYLPPTTPKPVGQRARRPVHTTRRVISSITWLARRLFRCWRRGQSRRMETPISGVSGSATC